jgi:predicted dehydrogenase
MSRGDGFRVGVVGAGYWGSKHVRAFRSVPGVGDITVIDPSDERVANVRRSIPGLNGRRCLSDALDDVDGVVIATPPSTHAPLALQAIEAGKHVLVEKPLATNVGDARAIMRAAAEREVVAMVGHTFEYHAAVWSLRDMVRSGHLGKLYYLATERLNMGLYQHDVNVLWDLAPHDISILNYVLDSQPTSVECWGSRHAHRRLEDVVYLHVQYDSPRVEATIHVSWLHPRKTRLVTAVGSQRMVIFDDLAEERLRVHDKGVQQPDDGADDLTQPPMSYRYGDVVAPYLVVAEPLLLEDEHFVTCALSGKEPSTGAANGLAVVEVLEAAQWSLQQKRCVEVAEVRERPTRLSVPPLVPIPAQRPPLMAEGA